MAKRRFESACTEEEMECWKKAAKLGGDSLSEWVRKACATAAGGVKVEVPEPDLPPRKVSPRKKVKEEFFDFDKFEKASKPQGTLCAGCARNVRMGWPVEASCQECLTGDGVQEKIEGKGAEDVEG